MNGIVHLREGDEPALSRRSRCSGAREEPAERSRCALDSTLHKRDGDDASERYERTMMMMMYERVDVVLDTER